eukprot:4472432-Prymnesium_polylepis.1
MPTISVISRARSIHLFPDVFLLGGDELAIERISSHGHSDAEAGRASRCVERRPYCGQDDQPVRGRKRLRAASGSSERDHERTDCNRPHGAKPWTRCSRARSAGCCNLHPRALCDVCAGDGVAPRAWVFERGAHQCRTAGRWVHQVPHTGKRCKGASRACH